MYIFFGAFCVPNSYSKIESCQYILLFCAIIYSRYYIGCWNPQNSLPALFSQSKQPMEEIHHKMVVLNFLRTKTQSLTSTEWTMMFFGIYQTTENISNQIKQKSKEIVPSGSIGSQLQGSRSSLPSFVHPACDMKFADTCVWLEKSMC